MIFEKLREIQTQLEKENHPLAKELLKAIEAQEEECQDIIWESWGEDN